MRGVCIWVEIGSKSAKQNQRINSGLARYKYSGRYLGSGVLRKGHKQRINQCSLASYQSIFFSPPRATTSAGAQRLAWKAAHALSRGGNHAQLGAPLRALPPGLVVCSTPGIGSTQ